MVDLHVVRSGKETERTQRATEPTARRVCRSAKPGAPRSPRYFRVWASQELHAPAPPPARAGSQRNPETIRCQPPRCPPRVPAKRGLAGTGRPRARATSSRRCDRRGTRPARPCARRRHSYVTWAVPQCARSTQDILGMASSTVLHPHAQHRRALSGHE